MGYLGLVYDKGFVVDELMNLEADEVPIATYMEMRDAATPIGSDLRFAGTLELTGLDLSINQRRVNAILRSGESYLIDAVSNDNGTPEIWSGLRPCSPDDLPYIGRSRAISNLVVATGHGTLGLSMGPITGKLVAQLVCEEQPELDLTAFAVDRFAD